MTRKTWTADARHAEDILIYCGEAMRNDAEQTQKWKFTYWLAVAVYHLLIAKLKGE